MALKWRKAQSEFTGLHWTEAEFCGGKLEIRVHCAVDGQHVVSWINGCKSIYTTIHATTPNAAKREAEAWLRGLITQRRYEAQRMLDALEGKA